MWLTIRHFLSLAMITLNLYLLLSHILILTTTRNVTALRLRGKKNHYTSKLSLNQKTNKVIVFFLLHKASPEREKKGTIMNFFNYRKEAVVFFIFTAKYLLYNFHGVLWQQEKVLEFNAMHWISSGKGKQSRKVQKNQC